jgi:hypothetical protein
MVGCYQNPVASSTGTGGSKQVCSNGESTNPSVIPLGWVRQRTPREGQSAGALGIPWLRRGSLGRGKLPIGCSMIGIAVLD